VGRVVRLQIQESSLKVGENPRRYDPSPLRTVPELFVATAGVSAPGEHVEPLIDVHNAEHPASKNARGVNGVSLGFTSHYAAMRERFGPHLTDGIAGENILIEAGGIFKAEDFARGAVIVCDDGRQFALERVIIAAPCVEFTRYALRFPDHAKPDRTVTEGLQFLHEGMRGFYATRDGEPGTVRLGDQLFVP
jgi:hypothetical protein